MHMTDKVIAVMLVFVAFVMLGGLHSKSQKLEKQIELILETQRQQKTLDESIKTAVFQLREKEATTTREVHYATREIERAVGANDPLPPGVDAAWRAGIERVRGKNPDSNAGIR